MKKILILGASGLVGKAIAKECLKDFDVFGTYFSSKTNLPDDKQFQLNIQDEKILPDILNLVQPDIIVSVLRGDFGEQLKFHRRLAEELKNSDSVLYFFSTTNVFDGDLSRHHSEADKPISTSEYGQYKIECEEMLVQFLGNRSNIIRIPGIWGKDSPRLDNMKTNIETNKPIQAYRNLECSFLLDVQIAHQMRFIFENDLRGIFHLSAVNMVKESAFLEELANQLTTGEVEIHYNHYQEKENTYYFGLVSNRNDLPDSLKVTNKEIISYLVH